MVRLRQSNNKINFALAGMICFLMFLPAMAQAKVFNSETFTLDNGLQVIVIPNHRAPVVTHMVWYKVGAADEPQGLSGMAHYFEHLMFKDSKNLQPGEFSKIVKKLGGNDNAFTGQDYTAYFESIAVSHLEKMMEMEAGRMADLDVPPDHFHSEKQVVLEERRQRTENDPRGIFNEQMKSALFVNHPYGTPVIGWMSEIKDYEWKDVKKFYDKWYAPNNAIVIISGDVTAKEVKPMAERTYGKIKPKEIPPRIRTQIPPANGQTKMTLKHEAIQQPAFQNLRIAPGYRENKKDSLALMVLEEILSGGPTTRLYKNLVVDQKKAVSVGFSYDGNALDHGTIWISGIPNQGVTLEELEALTKGEIEKVIKDGVTKQEVADAVQRMEDAAVYARDSVAGPAMTFGYSITTGSTIDDIENWPDLIKTVSVKDVQRVAETYLDENNPWLRPAITGYLLPLDADDGKKEGETK